MPCKLHLGNDGKQIVERNRIELPQQEAFREAGREALEATLLELERAPLPQSRRERRAREKNARRLRAALVWLAEMSLDEISPRKRFRSGLPAVVGLCLLTGVGFTMALTKPTIGLVAELSGILLVPATLIHLHNCFVAIPRTYRTIDDLIKRALAEKADGCKLTRESRLRRKDI